MLETHMKCVRLARAAVFHLHLALCGTDSRSEENVKRNARKRLEKGHVSEKHLLSPEMKIFATQTTTFSDVKRNARKGLQKGCVSEKHLLSPEMKIFATQTTTFSDLIPTGLSSNCQFVCQLYYVFNRTATN